MADPRFSILLPTHNRPEVLKFAIASVLAQTRTDWELLVVGDGCTDGTADMMAGYDDPRIRWFDLPKGPGFGYANRNVALRQARGDLIALLGHDNLYFRDHLDRMDPLFANPKVVFGYSRPLFIDDDGVIVPFYINLHMSRAREDFLKFRNVLPATTIVHRRSCLEKVGYWREDLERDGDWDLWQRIFQAHPMGFQMQRLPTSLHFRASWRKGKVWVTAPYSHMRALHAFGDWYPAPFDLKFDLNGPPAQEKVWALMLAEPVDFMARIWHNTDLLEDYLAWNSSMNVSFR